MTLNPYNPVISTNKLKTRFLKHKIVESCITPVGSVGESETEGLWFNPHQRNILQRESSQIGTHTCAERAKMDITTTADTLTCRKDFEKKNQVSDFTKCQRLVKATNLTPGGRKGLKIMVAKGAQIAER